MNHCSWFYESVFCSLIAFLEQWKTKRLVFNSQYKRNYLTCATKFPFFLSYLTASITYKKVFLVWNKNLFFVIQECCTKCYLKKENKLVNTGLGQWWLFLEVLLRWLLEIVAIDIIMIISSLNILPGYKLNAFMSQSLKNLRLIIAQKL